MLTRDLLEWRAGGHTTTSTSLDMAPALRVSTRALTEAYEEMERDVTGWQRNTVAVDTKRTGSARQRVFWSALKCGHRAHAHISAWGGVYHGTIALPVTTDEELAARLGGEVAD